MLHYKYNHDNEDNRTVVSSKIATLREMRKMGC